jgi:hypothetical protein
MVESVKYAVVGPSFFTRLSCFRLLHEALHCTEEEGLRKKSKLFCCEERDA